MKTDARILIVDDDMLCGQAVDALLQCHGYRTMLCHKPEQALASFRQTPGSFKLIISDNNMPSISGLQLLDSIHTIRPETPLILMSGLIPQNIPSHIMTLAKPIHFDTLLQFIDTLLDDSPTNGCTSMVYSEQPQPA